MSPHPSEVALLPLRLPRLLQALMGAHGSSVKVIIIITQATFYLLVLAKRQNTAPAGLEMYWLPNSILGYKFRN